MPGGKGNIKPGDNPKPFTSEYQPSEKWTEAKAIELGNELIEWINSDSNDNIFLEKFIVREKGYYPHLLSYLCGKFSTFLQLIEKAKKIQELKLVEYGLKGDINAVITKFTLVNQHNWIDKKEIAKTVEKKKSKEDLAKILKKAGIDPTKLEY